MKNQRSKKVKQISLMRPDIEGMHLNRIIDCYEEAERDYPKMGKLIDVHYWKGDGECHLHFENGIVKYR